MKFNGFGDNHMRRSWQILAMTTALVTFSGPVVAATLIIGTGTNVNAFPFGDTFFDKPTTYQQLYASSQFGSGPVAISSIGFIGDGGPPGLAGGTFNLSLSTTTKAVNGLDTSNFAANVGGDDTPIFSGPLAGQLNGTLLTFAFTPFIYDPSAGNLLLNVSVFNYSGGPPPRFLANNGDANGVFSRAHDFGVDFDNHGLVTFFTIDAVPNGAVPEPATWAMMLIGFGIVGAAMRRRAKVSVTYA